MSQENVEIVERAFDLWERGEVTALLDLMADDLVTYRVDPDGATYHGKEGFFQATAEWIEGFSEWSVRPDEFFDAGDQVIVRVRQSARGEASGIPVEEDFWFVLAVRNGKIAKLSFYSRELEALEAAGLSE
jgi:ketosteroid isomerase-like protein